MKHKPWPLVVLAIAHFVAPIFNIIGSSYMMGLPVMKYLALFIENRGASGLLSLLGMMPLAGYAIYAIKPWSYPLFLSIVGWEFYSNYKSYKEFTAYFNMPMFIFSYTLSIGLVSYFLVPAVRRYYFNRRLRWWESRPRYATNINATVELEGNTIDCTIKDLSRGGAFIEIKSQMIQNTEVKLEFNRDKHHFILTSRVVHRLHYEDDTVAGYGLEFELDRRTKRELKRLLKSFPKDMIKPRNAKLTWSGFKKWAKTLIKEGKGLFP